MEEMKYLGGFVIIVSILFAPFVINGEEMMQVRLLNHIGETSKLKLQIKGNYHTLDPMIQLSADTEYNVLVKNGKLILKGDKQTYNATDSLVLVPHTYDENHFIRINDRPYLGAMELRVENNMYIRPVNQLPLEDYLKGVVPFEVFPDWSLETLKAQALAARTYAASHIGKEIDDTIQYQVYGGYMWDAKTTKAITETEGEVITYKDKLINAFYSASNGGKTENNAHVWGGRALPFFPIKKDPYDPTHPWEFKLHEKQIDLDHINWDQPNSWDRLKEKDEEITASMKSWLNRNGYPGDVKILSIPEFKLSDKQLPSDRSVKGSISVEFLWRLFDGTVFVRNVHLENTELNRIRPMIGGNIFKSYLITSLEKEDAVYTMKGKGYGHGVGMSQWGAHVMGEKGKSYKDIIQFYFPKTEITQLNSKNKIEDAS